MSELAAALIVLGARYGIPWLTELIRTANNPGVTADDLLAALATAKPYEAYFPTPATAIEPPTVSVSTTPPSAEALATIPTVKEP